jgi:hypothetical protein
MSLGVCPELQEKLRSVMGGRATKRRAAPYRHDSSWRYVSHPFLEMPTLTVDVGVDVGVYVAVGIAVGESRHRSIKFALIL